MSYNNINKLAQSERTLAFICKQRFTKLKSWRRKPDQKGCFTIKEKRRHAINFYSINGVKGKVLDAFL